uniref:Uncharacterized protein n=1 Tax=Anguilla anguilla TaxID=7936 RepID=A0A0E9TIM8_ANGAN
MKLPCWLIGLTKVSYVDWRKSIQCFKKSEAQSVNLSST